MGKFKDYLRSKNQSKAWSFVDETIGSYVTFGAVVQHFGGWAWAPYVQGATHVAAKCNMMGPNGSRWMSFFSGWYNFLVLQQTHRDIFSKKWEEFDR